MGPFSIYVPKRPGGFRRSLPAGTIYFTGWKQTYYDFLYIRLFVYTNVFLQEGPFVVVADYFRSRLALWRLSDGMFWKHLGAAGREPGQFTLPQAVAVTGAGALVVTDEYRVQVLTVD